MTSRFQKTSWIESPLTWRRYREEQIWGVIGFKVAGGCRGGGVHQRPENPCLDIGTPTGTKDTDLGVTAHGGLCEDEIAQGECTE